MNKLDMKTMDMTVENIEKIGNIFPNVIVESANGHSIDFELLKQELSNVLVNENKEKYQLTWPGKREAILNANITTTNILRPIKDKSVNFAETENVYIEGDNLEALKILQESYLNKIKCIYIDPPYNTGNDFIYNDKFFRSEKEEQLESGEVDEEGNKLTSNSTSNGRFHSDWLSMMYSRLKLARNLLTDDGVMFISIDDNEQASLKKMCDEIFGEYNFIASCPRKTVSSVTTKSEHQLQKLNDYILIYTRNGKTNLKLKITGEKKYNYEDERGSYYMVPLQDNGPHGTKTARPNLYYPIFVNSDGKLLLEKSDTDSIEILPKNHKSDDGCWMWSKKKFIEDNNDLIIINNIPYIKHYYNEEEDQNKYQRYKTWLDEYLNAGGSRELNSLNLNGIFDYSKPVELIKFCINLANTKEDSIVLDFFSGSATTAQAVMELNSEDSGNRKYIMVQLPEECNDDSVAYKSGYKTICDIGEERIRRAANKIKDKTDADIDYGFRVYKIDSSNMKDIFYKPEELQQEMLTLFEDNIKEDRTELDLLTGVILDLGLKLDLSIEEKNIGENKVYFVDTNSLVACFDDIINIDIIEKICELKPLKVVFKDSSFKYDNQKINLQEKFKKLSPDTEISIL